ncbi:MAG: thioredoxin-disulfide reductase [Lachnospiraceae bacterium]|nr:thioredoxin-disulfide reductase [Lachnospiraceae bacterium]
MGEMLDTLIIGAGPAGLSAGIYGLRAGLKLLLLEKAAAGGQVQSTYAVDNYPGLPGISGMDLSLKMKEHFEKVGGTIMTAEVTGVQKEAERRFLVKTDQGDFACKSVLLAAGAHHAKLGVPGEEELAGCGVSYCATCDGAFYKGAVTAVVGGGNVAVEDAIFLARFCEKVYLIHRRDTLRAEKALQDVLLALPNVEILWDTTVECMQGDGELESLVIRNLKTDEQKELAVEGVFVAVGILPDTERFTNLAKTDEQGYFIAGEDGRTSEPGIFVAGDARKKPLRQILTAAADGANAITSAAEYIREFT